MACRTPSVQRAANKTTAAANAVTQLEAALRTKDAANKAEFFQNIDSHLADAKVTDAREVSYSSDVKTEYSSEFSLDKIAAVVTSALTALAKTQDPTNPKPAMSPEAIAAYTDVVNTVAEAAKSSSQSASSLSFSMNRIAPGSFAFLYATSVNITDKETFGSEAVTSTSIYYRFMQSIQDLKNEAKFGEAVIDARNLINMKTLQAALTDRLATGNITIDQWTDLDAKYSGAIATISQRLQAASFDTTSRLRLVSISGFGGALDHSFATGSPSTQRLVRASVAQLIRMGPTFRDAVIKSQERLSKNYY